MDTMDIVIESPRATHVKYKYDPKKKIFRLRRVLPLGMVFPYDFGFIPDTAGEDGDPLDALVLSEIASFTGAHLTCRLIGALKAEHCQCNDRLSSVCWPVHRRSGSGVLSLLCPGKDSREERERKQIDSGHNPGAPA